MRLKNLIDDCSPDELVSIYQYYTGKLVSEDVVLQRLYDMNDGMLRCNQPESCGDSIVRSFGGIKDSRMASTKHSGERLK